MKETRITCLVDNCVMRGSSLWGEHGISFLIEHGSSKILWDTGQSGRVLEHNLKQLKMDSLPLTAVGLSHAHYDHTGGLSVLLARYSGLSIYAHREIFRPRYSQHDGETVAIGLSDRKQSLAQRANLQLSEEPQELAEGVWTTGTIRPRPYPQGSSQRHMTVKDGELVPDDYADDMSLVVEREDGIILICGCCHAGLRNTVKTVRRYHAAPLVAILGGTHLAHADQSELNALCDLLKDENEPALYLNHCTGETAIWRFQQVFGAKIAPCPAGAVLTF